MAPNLQYAVLGTRVELQCDIEADEVNALDTWAVGEETDFSTGVNVIPSVVEGDEGRYTCRLNDPLELMDDFDIPIYLRITGAFTHTLTHTHHHHHHPLSPCSSSSDIF